MSPVSRCSPVYRIESPFIPALHQKSLGHHTELGASDEHKGFWGPSVLVRLTTKGLEIRSLCRFPSVTSVVSFDIMILKGKQDCLGGVLFKDRCMWVSLPGSQIKPAWKQMALHKSDSSEQYEMISSETHTSIFLVEMSTDEAHRCTYIPP